jgi:hypothetical protein
MHADSAKTLGVGTLYAGILPPQPMIRFRSGRHRSRAPVVHELGHIASQMRDFGHVLPDGGDGDFICMTCSPSLGHKNASRDVMLQGCRTVLRVKSHPTSTLLPIVATN